MVPASLKMSVMNLKLSTPKCGVVVSERTAVRTVALDQKSQEIVARKTDNYTNIIDESNNSCSTRFVTLRT